LAVTGVFATLEPVITRRLLVNLSVALMLIGVGVVFAAGIGFWPWILAVVGIATLPGAASRDRFAEGLQTAVWMVGLTVLFALDAMWPWIIAVVALSAAAQIFVPVRRVVEEPPRSEDEAP
jgi:hypothetical protein